jgi:hypothetical protein
VLLRQRTGPEKTTEQGFRTAIVTVAPRATGCSRGAASPRPFGWLVAASGKITSTVGLAGAVLHPERRACGPQPSGPFVEALLGRLRAVGGQGLHRVCGAPDDSFDVDLRLKGREDEIGDGSRVPTIRAADADP